MIGSIGNDAGDLPKRRGLKTVSQSQGHTSRVLRRSEALTRVEINSLRPTRHLKGSNVAALDLGEPDAVTPPVITEAMAQALRDGYTHYAPPNGDPDLLNALAAQTSRIAGQEFGIDNVSVTHGACGGLGATIMSIVNPGDRVVIPEPTYSLYRDLVHLAGGEPQAVPLNSTYHLDLQVLAEAVPGSRLVILCNPGNPTGAVIDRKSLTQLADVLAGHETFLLVDEAYSAFVYDARFTSALEITELRPRTIVVNTFSKAFAMTGWRLGWVVAPPDLTTSVRTAHRTFNGGLNAAVQRAGIAAIEHAGTFVPAMLEMYRARRDLVFNRLSQMRQVSSHKPEGAFYAFLRYNNDLTATEMVEALQQGGVALRPGSEFGRAGEHHLRLSFASTPDVLNVGLERLEATLEQVAR